MFSVCPKACTHATHTDSSLFTIVYRVLYVPVCMYVCMFASIYLSILKIHQMLHTSCGWRLALSLVSSGSLYYTPAVDYCSLWSRSVTLLISHVTVSETSLFVRFVNGHKPIRYRSEKVVILTSLLMPKYSLVEYIALQYSQQGWGGTTYFAYHVTPY